MHCSLNNSLCARLLGRVNWLSELPRVMLGLRAACNLDTAVSPSISVTGQQPTRPGELVVQRPTIDDASTFGRKLASGMAAQAIHENTYMVRETSVTDVVDTGKSDRIDDLVYDLVVRRSNTTVSPPLRL